MTSGNGSRYTCDRFAVGDPRPRARQKLAAKQVDLIVANDVSRAGAGFDVETNAATFLSADGEEEQPLQPKTALAARLLDRVEQLLLRAAAAGDAATT